MGVRDTGGDEVPDRGGEGKTVVVRVAVGLAEGDGVTYGISPSLRSPLWPIPGVSLRPFYYDRRFGRTRSVDSNMHIYVESVTRREAVWERARVSGCSSRPARRDRRTFCGSSYTERQISRNQGEEVVGDRILLATASRHPQRPRARASWSKRSC